MITVGDGNIKAASARTCVDLVEQCCRANVDADE